MSEPEIPDAPPADAIPDLFFGAALVALVPATADLEAASVMAWQVARATASAGRRVALVDGFVDEPHLHAAAGEDNRDGIVDVFEYGASLSRIARQQADPNLYFVPAGTFAPDAAVMAAHPRWRRLSAGFRHEDALMLLYLPADCLASLASALDGMVALAPDGPEAGLASTPEIEAALEAGVPLLAALSDVDVFEIAGETAAPALPPHADTVRATSRRPATGLPALESAPRETPEAPAVERESAWQRAPVTSDAARSMPAPESAWQSVPAIGGPGETASPTDSAADVSLDVVEVEAPEAEALDVSAQETTAPPAVPLFRRLPLPRSSWGVRAAVYGCVAVLAAAVLIVTYRRELGLGDLGLTAPGAGEEPDSAPPMSIVPGYRTLVPHAVDTLPFAVQVSAWASLVFALDAADGLQSRGFPPIVAPIRLGGRLWYRVFTGPVAAQDAADSLLGALRDSGLDRSRTAVPVLVPLSLALRRLATLVAARAERTRLRGAGLPAFILGEADGSYRLFGGAYARPEQAAYLDTLVTSTGSAGQIGPRVGFRP